MSSLRPTTHTYLGEEPVGRRGRDDAEHAERGLAHERGRVVDAARDSLPRAARERPLPREHAEGMAVTLRG